MGQTKADILRGGWVGSDMGCRSKVPPVQRNGTQGAPVVANSIDESTFNQIASKPEAQSKILRLLDELAVHYQTLWGLGGHP